MSDTTVRHFAAAGRLGFASVNNELLAAMARELIALRKLEAAVRRRADELIGYELPENALAELDALGAAHD